MNKCTDELIGASRGSKSVKQMKNLADKILIFIKTLYHTSVMVIDTFK